MRYARFAMSAAVAACLLLTVGTAIAQSGAGGWTFLGDEAHTNSVGPVSVPLALKWSCPITGPGSPVGGAPAATSAAAPGSTTVATPAIVGNRIYVVYGQSLYVMDRTTGTPLARDPRSNWPVNMGVGVSCSPVVDNGIIYLGGDDGSVWAIDAISGTKLWRITTQGAIKAAVLIHEGMMFVASTDGSLYAVNIAEQNIAWRYATNGPIVSTPAIRGDKLYVASQDGHLHAMYWQEGGRAAWSAPLGSNETYASPVVADRQVLVSGGATLIAFDAASGERRWDFKAQASLMSQVQSTNLTGGDSDYAITGSPTVADRSVFVGSRNGQIYQLRLSDGFLLWSYPSGRPAGPVASAPIAAGPAVFSRMGNSALFGFAVSVPSAQVERVVWAYTLPAAPAAAAPTTGMPGVSGTSSGPGSSGFREMSNAGQGSGSPLSYNPQSGVGLAGPSGTGLGTGLGMMSNLPAYETMVASGIAMSGNDLYIAANDGCLYAFSGDWPDNEPPVVTGAQLTVFERRTDGSVPTTFGLWADPVDSFLTPPDPQDIIHIPGSPPIYVSLTASDNGSGIDPTKVAATLDGVAVGKDELTYVAVDGLAWYIYQPDVLGGVANLMAPGLHKLEITAMDWSGNVGGARVYFFIDNSVPWATLRGAPIGAATAAPGVPGMPPGMGGPGGNQPTERQMRMRMYE